MEKTEISVIIPVGKGHEQLAIKAVHSVLMQHRPDFEVIVINDTKNNLSLPEGVKLIQGRKLGPSAARNDGADIAQGEALVFLDADDVLCPGALHALWHVYEQTGKIVYGNVIRSDKMEIHSSPEQYCGEDIKKTSLYVPKRMPTHLVPRTAHFSVGGFDEDISLWEDVDYEIALDIAGYCAVKIDYPIYFYNWDTGTRRRSDLAQEAKQYIKIKYEDYMKGSKSMGCTGCGGSKSGPVPRFSSSIQDNNMLSLFNEKVLELEYIGNDPSVKSYPGPVTGRHYRFGATKAERTRKARIGLEDNQVHPDDAKEMARLSDRNHGKQFRINVIGNKQPVEEKQETSREVKQNLKVEMEADQAEIMKNAVLAGMSIDKFTVRELRESVDSVAVPTLTRWLEEEQNSDNPRVTVIDILETKIGIEDADLD